MSSRVPLREAVPLLERDGFVHSYPRRVSWWPAGTRRSSTTRSTRDCPSSWAPRATRRGQVTRGGSMDALNVALNDAQGMVEAGDAYAIAQSSTAFHEAVVETSANDLMMRLIQTISGRITWLFYLTSGLPVEEAFHDHVLLRDAIASGNDRVAESVSRMRTSSGIGNRHSRPCEVQFDEV